MKSRTIIPTTFIHSDKLSSFFDLDITIASETFQHTGSFKFRAAFNVALSVKKDHLIAASSGNFGQALAYSCQLLGKKCHVVMPQTSAKVKIDAVKEYGAFVDLIDVKKVGREERVSQLMTEFPDAYRAHAFDDPLVIEGNSTLGREIANHADDFDSVIVPIGGGGLISGIATGLRAAGSAALVYGAEPLEGNDAARSLRAGKIVSDYTESKTIADGARARSIGKHNWAIMKHSVKDIIEVSEDSILTALVMLFRLANLKVEPTGALSVGALLEHSLIFDGKKVCLVVSGANVDRAVYQQMLSK